MAADKSQSPPKSTRKPAGAGAGGLLASIQGFNKGKLKSADKPAIAGGEVTFLSHIRTMRDHAATTMATMSPAAAVAAASGGSLLAQIQAMRRGE